ncbi:MAG TPA: hypothetical protein DCS66_21670 [Flavobacteriaceae bacterium]|nr:hypothetical protein [Flavobacteriaceae bacterium]
MKQNDFKFRILLFLLISPFLMVAQVSLSGKVNSDKGDTVPFVNVIEKGTSNGTTTDMDGNYRIEVSSLPATLVFSSLGYETFEQSVSAAG